MFIIEHLCLLQGKKKEITLASCRSFVCDFYFFVLVLKYKHSLSLVELFEVDTFGVKFVS